MSTKDSVRALEAAGKLVRIRLRVRGGFERAIRRVSVAPEMYAWLTAGSPKPSQRLLKAALLGHFEAFSRGDRVDDCRFMKRVEPFEEDIWTLSPRFTDPQFRFFGAFAAPNWFVAFTKLASRDLDDTQKWNRARDKARRTWDAMFPENLRFRAASFEDYVTFNSEHCDERWY